MEEILTGENGVIETIGVFILAISGYILAKNLWRPITRQGLIGNCSEYVYCALLFCVPFLGVSRELSFGESIGLSNQAVDFTKVILSVFLFSYLIFVGLVWMRGVEHKGRHFLSFLTCSSSLYVYGAIGVFGLSTLFEKSYLGFPHSVLAEELLEMAAYSVFFYSVLLAIRKLKSNTQQVSE